MNLPNYLHIGYSKAASSWLQKLLKEQKSVFMVYKSDFFFPLDSGKFNEGLEYYSKFFEGSENFKVKIESHEHIILPFFHPELKCASTNLKVVRENAIRIKSVLPDIKIVIIIRNQLEMLLSRYTQYVLQGGKLSAELFFSKLIFDESDKFLYADYRYSKVITLLFQVFGKDQVCVLLQEQLKNNPKYFLSKLEIFFNISFNESEDGQMKGKNPAPSVFGIQMLRVFNRLLVREIEIHGQRTQTYGPYFLWFVLGRVVRKLDNIMVKNKRKKELINADLVAQIKELFSEDNKKLADLLKISIRDLGYDYKG